MVPFNEPSLYAASLVAFELAVVDDGPSERSWAFRPQRPAAKAPAIHCRGSQ